MAAELLRIKSNYQATKHTEISASAFVEKWGANGKAARLGERAGAQAHFMDLCHLLGVPTPDDPDTYCFEKGFRGIVSGRGFADVWKRDHFGWEYKAPGGDLGAALKQLIQYALPLENPPLLVVSDRLTTEVHTHFTGHPSTKTSFALQDLLDPTARDLLRAVFDDPYRFKPGKTVQQLTEEAASTVAAIADQLRGRGVSPRVAAHFLTQCVFCFFADDAGLLPSDIFKRLVQKRIGPRSLQRSLTELFGTMQAGGSFGVDDIPWFNGGLFKDIEVPELLECEIATLSKAASHNWRFIDAAIFGTLFERGLDPSKRAQLGAHYTDTDTIKRLLEPAIRRPLLAEWARIHEQIATSLSKRDYIRVRAKGMSSKSPALKERYARLRTQANEAEREAQALFSGFLGRLTSFRVLDPACGSGNFLYMALKCLKDVEHIANVEAEQLGLQRQLPVTGPHNLLGIEINEFASELAKVTVWIGELQWLREHGYQVSDNPILQPLDHIQTRDALIEYDGSPASWPDATVIVGNPPFLGTKKQRRELGVEYVKALRGLYSRRVPPFADLVCYWFSNAQRALLDGKAMVAALVATNSIRGGLNRKVLDQIVSSCEIFEAWDELPWINEGAAVKVSLIAFALKDHGQQVQLNGVPVSRINPDLTTGADLATARPLPENRNCCFCATVKGGHFECDGATARRWLQLPNPNGKSNALVVKRWANGLDVVRRPSDNWLVDFGCDMSQAEAELFEAPYRHVQTNVLPERIKSNRPSYKKYWWLFAEPVPKMRAAVSSLHRQLVTVIVAKHRIFTWLDQSVLPDHQLAVIARADDYTFGILQSRFHSVWSLGLGTSLEDRPRYTPTTCFETFPFPHGLTPKDTADQQVEEYNGALIPKGLRPPYRTLAGKVAIAARRLHVMREAWLNPPEWTIVVPEIVPINMKISPYAARVVPRPDIGQQDMKELQRRTMTNLYNDPPAWLVSAHQALDLAVADAYGWDFTPETPDERLLAMLLVENERRAVASYRSDEASVRRSVV
ncbi:class I SAM-dependent DNA methyltransferase [Burkholderia ubonensis]|uniref:class I SAM-dependent DNA methyltransferase n=1 Tax=Burkholderia ubonensis TaxID=101571 RepID=UPI000AFDEBD6|nr:class I SAM-dependent DNA methyltransferase [Burkholderia ubonensis]